LLKKLITYIKNKRSKKELNSKNRETESVNSSIISVPQGRYMQRKKSIDIAIRDQITANDSKKKCCGCWENNVH
jgi:hypothetical protein